MNEWVSEWVCVCSCMHKWLTDWLFGRTCYWSSAVQCRAGWCHAADGAMVIYVLTSLLIRQLIYLLARLLILLLCFLWQGLLPIHCCAMQGRVGVVQLMPDSWSAYLLNTYGFVVVALFSMTRFVVDPLLCDAGSCGPDAADAAVITYVLAFVIDWSMISFTK